MHSLDREAAVREMGGIKKRCDGLGLFSRAMDTVLNDTLGRGCLWVACNRSIFPPSALVIDCPSWAI